MNNAHVSNSPVTISSNTLFHFTSTIDHIRSILEDEFWPNLSLEDLSCLELEKVAIPMVSFCDIPLSQTKTHMERYGSYGIGLSKSWGKKNGVNPVLYTYQGSPLATGLNQSLAWTYAKYLGLRKLPTPHVMWARIASIARAERQGATRHRQYGRLWDQLLKIQCFIKPYEGPFYRNNQQFQNVRFYDEREWRFVPGLRGDLIKYLLYEDEYNDKTVREKANREIRETRIGFEPSDIKYIIVSRNEEILPLIKVIEDIKGARYEGDPIKLLCSKIICADDIEKDF